MMSSRLSQIVDVWTLLAVEASRYLTRLYRALGDGRQAARAIQSGVPAEERSRRLRLSAEASQYRLCQETAFLEDCQMEAKAWQALIEAHAGVAAFHAMAEGGSPAGSSLQGSRSANAKAFHQALHGFRVAFPESMANEAIMAAIRLAATTCTEALLMDLEDGADGAGKEALAQEFHQNILEALMQAAGLDNGGR